MSERESHWDKIAWLRANLPEGVPLEEGFRRCTACGVSVAAHDKLSPGCPLPATAPDAPWPETFGAIVDGRAVHRADGGVCLQCLVCRHYDEGDGDWGTCRAPGGQYAGREVFEHWTCQRWEYGPDGDEGDGE